MLYLLGSRKALKDKAHKDMNNDTCTFCDNTGIVYHADGQDDYQVDYCSCDFGVALEYKNESNVLAYV